MARLTDAIITKGQAYSGQSPTLDLGYGGQQGYMPRLGTTGPDGKVYEEWINNTLYIRQNVIPIVLRYPKFMDLMQDSKLWIRAYKAMIEEHPTEISGLSSGLTVDTDSSPIGGAGEEQEQPTNTKREKSNISITIPDKAGKSVMKFFDMYIRYGIQDPDVKKPLVSQFIDTEKQIGLYTPEWYTGMVIFIEPDITQQIVLDAWLAFNFFPKSNGSREGSRNVTDGGQRNDISLEFSSIVMNNQAAINLGQSLLKKLTVLKQIPDTHMITPTNGIDPSVSSVDFGFNRKFN